MATPTPQRPTAVLPGDETRSPFAPLDAPQPAGPGGRRAKGRGPVQRFSSVLESAEAGVFVSVPFDVELAFGRRRVPVKVTMDGEPYRGSLVHMGGPSHVLLVLKRIRDRLGKGPGDSVDVVVEEDLRPRTFAVPADLRRALARRPEARRAFRALPHACRRSYVRWVESARRKATRARRVARVIATLGRGKRGR